MPTQKPSSSGGSAVVTKASTKKTSAGENSTSSQGRIKELINRGGVKFSPFDIEEVLLEIPGVKVGLAVGFKNDYYGEEVGAYVVLEKGHEIEPAEILSYCRGKMTFEKSPKVVVFGEDVPITSTGKYQRLKLVDRFAEWEHTQFRK